MLAASLLLSLLLLHPQEAESASDQADAGKAMVFRLDLVETLDGEALKNVTVVIRDGVVEQMGEAVVIPKGAEVHDLRGTGAMAMPPLVVSHANYLVRSSRSRGHNGRFRAVDSLTSVDDESLEQLREEGVLIVGVDPPGSGIAGRTSVLNTASGGDYVRVSDLHLKITVDANSSAKDLLRKALTDADKAIEKEDKARKEWEKARQDWEEKQKKKEEEQKEKKDKEKDGKEGVAAADDDKGGKGKEEKEPPKEFEPPKVPDNTVPIVEWIEKERLAQVWINNASEWLHWKDIQKDRELPYELILQVSSFRSMPSQNFGEVLDEIGAESLRVYFPAVLSVLPNTRFRVNLPAQLLEAGARLVLTPRGANFQAVQDWRVGLADLVREGLDRSAALKAVTLEPALAIGQEDVVHALKVGAAANFVVFSGDVLDPVAQVRYMVVDGEIIYDREKEEAEEE